MKTVKGDKGELKLNSGTSVAIGNFDGVHKGHTKLLKKLSEISKAFGLISLVYTFSEHPQKSKAITDLSEKIEIIENLGVDILYLEDFEKVKDLYPEEFIKDILIDKLNAKHIVIGENNRFGKNAEGDAELLKKLSEKYGFSVTVVKHVYIDGVLCSSTEIRKCIENGNVKKANELLGRNYKISGDVISGKKLGRTYGFPTANLKFSYTKVTLKSGVYATNVCFGEKVYRAITNVGTTSFDETEIKRIETFIIDFEGDLYGKTINIEFIEKMRDFIPFENIKELEEQLIKDKENRLNITEEMK